MSQELSFKLAFDDFDRSLLGNPQLDASSEEFRSKVTQFFTQQFQGFGGKARVIVNDQEHLIEVVWTKEKSWRDPKQKALDLLNSRSFDKALPLLSTLYHANPTDEEVLYRLGLCYSELGQYDQAALILEKLVEVDPSHVHGIVGIGVAEIARGNFLIGEEWLRNALAQEPDNRWALRNLAASLMKQGRYEDALPVIAKCISVAPTEIAMMVAYGDCLDELGRGDESLAHYRAAIETGGPEHILDLAKSRLTKKSADGLRGSGEIRTDVLEYMQQALEQFKSMSLSQIQGLALEIAMLGNQGMNIHKSDRMYQLKALPGEYPALQLISMMYAAFQQFAPGTDVGIDLSKEYELATKREEN
jgi:tetratricopeptide (TPR) repeat protein